jgi:predicted acetyltransferase
MPTTLRPIGDDDRPVLERLWQLYRHDLSELRDTHPNDEGLFKPGRLPSYFGDPNRCGYFIESDTGLAGFVLVDGVIEEARGMGEFFVLRSARRRGIGHDAAIEALRLHPGRWEIAFQEENRGAARFWRGIAAEIAGLAYREERRPVPSKPHIPPDVWISLSVPYRLAKLAGVEVSAGLSGDGAAGA